MIRKNLIAMTAAATVLLGFAAIPANAAVQLYAGAPIISDGDYKQDVSHWVQKCRFVKIKTYYGWKTVKRCKKVFPKHYNSY